MGAIIPAKRPLFIYGVIMDTANVLIYQGYLNKGLLLVGPMIEKLERIQIKYGIIDAQ